MKTKPVIGLAEIHREYFVSESGQEIMSIFKLTRLSKEMQEFGAVAKLPIFVDGHKRVHIIALEPFFSLWRRRKLCGIIKKEPQDPEEFKRAALYGQGNKDGNNKVLDKG